MDQSIDVARQLAQHAAGLRAAGVDWLPSRRSAARSSLTAAVSLFTADDLQPPAPPSDDRRTALTVLAETVRGCTRCPELASTRTQTVFGVGPLDPEVCFVGEAPGADEDKRGEPFVGAAGQLLDKIFAACGFRRDEVYICNILKCRPPGNRTPADAEADNCRGFFEQQLQHVRPKFLVALGLTAAKHLLKTNSPLGKLRGKFHDYNGIPVLVTYHPAFLLPHRQPAKKADVWEDMKLLLRKLGREIPGAKS